MDLQTIIQELKDYDGKEIKIMEVCGTHTSSIFKHGIRSIISPKIQLISGPGCPVCVTPPSYIDKLVEYSFMDNCCILTFGDMMKVKGSNLSLTNAKAGGGDVRILYSPLIALSLAKESPNTNFIFAAVGFETTTPIYALMIEQMKKENIKNLKLLTSIKKINPALHYICANEKNIDAFLCPGHVSVITGSNLYEEIVETYNKPCVISGFEGEHILASIYEILMELKNKESKLKNMYTSVVTKDGNEKALNLIQTYFNAQDDYWRGIGVIKASGYVLKEEYSNYDAGSIFNDVTENMPPGCRCTDIILGRIQPTLCPLFSKTCTPINAIGPCMVSTEGACGIWYKNRGSSHEN